MTRSFFILWALCTRQESFILLEIKYSRKLLLTCYRKNLSLSLNFRPTHNNPSSFTSNTRYLSHCLLVLLGLRPSISHLLRSYLLANPSSSSRSQKTYCKKCDSSTNLASIVKELPEIPTTACYLIFCDGNQTVVFEKDHITAQVRASESFITATNHDRDAQHEEDESHGNNEVRPDNRIASILPLEDWIQESTERMECVESLWAATEKAHYRKHSRNRGTVPVTISNRTALRWMIKWPVSNECTHYWCLMDAKTGNVRACLRYLWPLEEPSQS